MSRHETNTNPMAPTDTTMPERDSTDRFGQWGRCVATNRKNERCGQPATGPHGKCYFHGGASTGPDDPSVLEGNDHAEGNSGGGPPELNANAVKHGAFGDLDKLPPITV